MIVQTQMVCMLCNKTFFVPKRYIDMKVKNNAAPPKFCSRSCSDKSKISSIPMKCSHCGSPTSVTNYMYCKSKTGRFFCSRSCAATYNNTNQRNQKNTALNCAQCNREMNVYNYTYKNSQTKRFYCSKKCAGIYNSTHKTYGYSRSKLEIWIENQLSVLLPNIVIEYNKRDVIDSELDIYIPSLKLAFEINGVYHYEPIHGLKLLEKTKTNDLKKAKSCAEIGIELRSIDTSKLKVYGERNYKPYLDMIIGVITSKAE